MSDKDIDTEWMMREFSRFKSGEYYPLPWNAATLSPDMVGLDPLPSIGKHYAHLSLKHPGMVAYTENPEKGRADIQAVCKPGRYITRHISPLVVPKPGKMADELVAKYVAVFALYDKMISAIKSCQVEFATDEDAIEWVYMHGPRSCMSHPVNTFGTNGVHPVRVYAAGDLAVAYLKSSDDKVACRALCWPEKKIYTRIYGDNGSYQNKFVRELEKLGYKQSKLNATDELNGAKLCLKRLSADTVIMPYVDWVHFASLSEDETHIVLDTFGSIATQSPKGVATVFMTCNCTVCGEKLRRNQYNELVNCYQYDGRIYCVGCYEELFGTCECCGGTRLLEELQSLNDSDVMLCLDCMANNTSTCSCCGDRFMLDDMQYVGENDEVVCPTCYEHYVACVDCNVLIHEDDCEYLKGEGSCICKSCMKDRIEADKEDEEAYVKSLRNSVLLDLDGDRTILLQFDEGDEPEMQATA